MSWFANIWNHPRTTVTGVLIGVSSVAGVLTQQGVTIGHVGNGNVVTLASALAAALLGLVARDPGNTSTTVDGSGATTSTAEQSSSSAQSTSGAILKSLMLISLLLPLPFAEGCTANSVAQQIVNWTPAMQSAVATVDATATVLDPADAELFQTATAGFNAASNLLAVQAKAYLANPSADTLAQLQTQVVALQQQVNAALLSAARITNSASQQKALAAIQAVATAVIAILALVQSVSSKQAVAQMAAASTVKLAVVTPYLDREAAAETMARHYGEQIAVAREQVVQSSDILEEAGF